MLDGFANAVHQHQELLASLQLSDLATMARYPRGLVPVGEWIGMQLIELIVHEWDMREPVEPDARLVSFAVEPVLKVLPETHLRFLSHRLEGNDASMLKDGGYRICAGSMEWVFRIRSQRVTYEAGSSVPYRTSFYADPETLILLTLGRLDVASQLAIGACRFEGHPDIDTTLYEVILGPYISASVIPPNVA